MVGGDPARLVLRLGGDLPVATILLPGEDPIEVADAWSAHVTAEKLAKRLGLPLFIETPPGRGPPPEPVVAAPEKRYRSGRGLMEENGEDDWT
jgi:hypothetical protein